MKNIIFMLLMSIFITVTSYLYSMFSSMSMELMKLKSVNKNLVSKNKQLVSKQNSIKKKLKNRRILLTKHKLKKAKYRLAKAPIKMIPFLGATAIVTFTAIDIRDYCNDIKNYKDFENSLFTTFDNNLTEDEKLLCGLNVEDYLKDDLKKYSTVSKEWVNEYYHKLTDTLQNRYSNILNLQ